MTAHANSLTTRATRRDVSASTTTLAAHDLRVFLDGLGRLGYNVAGLLAAAGLKGRTLATEIRSILIARFRH
jgi:hypothetical protein